MRWVVGWSIAENSPQVLIHFIDPKIESPWITPTQTSSSLLLRGRLGLCGFLLVAVDHHNRYERAHHS